MDKSDRETIFFSGYAKLPVGITATEMYKVIGVVIVLDPSSEEIVDADCTLATQVGRNFVKNILIGSSMSQGIEPLLKNINYRYHGSAKKALVTALKIINDKYKSYKEGSNLNVVD